MEKLVADFFKAENIKYYSCLEASECKLLYPHKLPEYTKSVCFFLIPYFCRDNSERNISLYSVPEDYHLYVRELSERFKKHTENTAHKVEYRFFADNSPFCERSCAEKCGLGKIGKNGLLINCEYGSFTFIGSICFSTSISITQRSENFKGDLCENCEKCKTSCPMHRGICESCLSDITQKKKITEDEARIISGFPIKWGCDICQNVCPYNSDIAETPIEFFKINRIPHLTEEKILGMSEEDFKKRAYSWRGIDVIKRNLGL
ncbi:MAG: DUF1730 domain-containing protein [Clostridia bacterium]|nr:DUF1730 domain-containing protein [Clostridia bacterium]